MLGAPAQANYSAAKLFAGIGCDPAGQKGLFLAPLLLVAKMLHSPEGREGLSSLDHNVLSSIARSCVAMARALQHPSASPAAVEALDIVFELLDDIMQSSGPPFQYLAAVLQRLVDFVHVQQQRSGLSPSWLPRYEKLVYRISVNEGVLHFHTT